MRRYVRVLGMILISMAWLSAASAESILIIGDSLSCGPFGRELFSRFNTGGNQVTLYCAVSSAPSNWMTGLKPTGQFCQTMTTASSNGQRLDLCGGAGEMPTLSAVLSQHKGARIIVGLGTNTLLSGKADASYRKMAKAVGESAASCDWIGPPHMNPSQSKGFPPGRVAQLEKNLNDFYDSLATSVGSTCPLIDSREATFDGTAGNQTVDGVHRSATAGKFWVDQIWPQLSEKGTSAPKLRSAPVSK
ncbi:MAG: hypothetical protein JNJ49_06895 [Bdellovibrionaceae bacterium]|nr:hypothetical protein [Pseudobdellovibrionaceae bacterium]